MAPLKISDREKKLVTIALCCALLYLFYTFLLAPKWDDVNNLNRSLRKDRQELKIAEIKIKLLEKIGRETGAMPETSQAPKEEKALEVLKSLAQATSKSGLNLVAIKPIIKEEGGFQFDLNCKGSYKDLYNFLRILHTSKIMVKIDSLNISGGGSRKPELSVNILLTAFY
ncbi:MAG: type II secretion system protein M [Candidatus Saganbacteria bacterium]|nr:type II secretion system protein M [Candidatus Saganbacteria bacterium]